MVQGSLGALATTMVACSSDDEPFRFRGERPPTNVNVVYDESVDFSLYETFAFREETGADSTAARDPGLRRDLELVDGLVAAELRDRGLIEVSADEADLLAFSSGRTSTATDVDWYCVGGFWGGSWYWGYYYDPCAWVDADYVEIDRTTLAVGLYDPALDDVTFAGFARGIGAGRGQRRREIQVAIARIFESYPGRPGAVEDAGSGASMDTPDGGAAPPDGAPSNGVTDAGSAADAGLADAGLGDAGALP